MKTATAAAINTADIRTVPTRCLTSSWRKSSASNRFAEENRPNPADEAPVVKERNGSENGRTLHFPCPNSAQQIVPVSYGRNTRKKIARSVPSARCRPQAQRRSQLHSFINSG